MKILSSPSISKFVFLSIFLGSLFISSSSSAQKGWEVGGWIGVSNYFGDLNTSTDLTRPGLAFGIIGKRNFNERVSLRGALSYGRVSGDDAESSNNFERNRNLSFRSNLFEFSSVFEFNFFPLIYGSTDNFYTPYILGGFNITAFNPTAELNGNRYSLRDFGTEGQLESGNYASITGGLLFGAGWKWDIGNYTTLNFELGYRRLFTDYLDDVSTVYPNRGALPSDIARQLSDRSLIDGLGAPGRQRGDSKGNDSYTFFSISLLKYWGKLECPKISEF